MRITLYALLLFLTACPRTPEVYREPVWLQYSTANGDMPAPNTGRQQTASQILDIDRDGIDDFVITERTGSPSVVWYKIRGLGSWERHIVETAPLRIEAGGAHYDIDGDGDLDLVFAGDARSNEIWWWENPYPDYKTGVSWKRRLIKRSEGNKHHDQLFGDFDGDDKAELASWNQKADALLLFEIPDDPKNSAEEWPRSVIFKAQNGKGRFEGIAKADVNGDGVEDIIGAGRWFEYAKGNRFIPHIIDGGSGREFTRSAAGQLVEGGPPEVVIVPGDADGVLKWYELKAGEWMPHLLKEEIIHGHSLAVTDINGDGFTDIFVGEMGKPGAGPNARTMVFYGNGKGEFREQLIAVGKANHESRVGDLNGDDKPDILSKPYGYGAPGFQVFLQDEKSLEIDSWQRHFIDSLPERAMFIKTADLNNDGLKDIIAGAWWWENPGAVSGKWQRRTIGAPLNNMFEVLDADNDGHIDIIGTQGFGSATNRRFAWARNDGKGNFQVLTNIDSCSTGDFLQGAAVEDFGNGRQIALSWHKGADGIYMISIPEDPINEQWNNQLATSSSLKEAISTGDIDGDGDIDMCLGNVWLENQEGAWVAHTIGELSDLDQQGEPDRNALVDINNDGRKDVVIALENGIHILWFECPEDPRQPWQRHVIGIAEGQGFSMDVKDVDRDGDFDVILGEHRGEQDNRVFIFKNNNSGQDWEKMVIDTGSKKEIDHHLGTQTSDLDNDGDLDIVSIGWYNPRVWIMENKNK